MTRFLSFGEHFKCVICYPPNICDSPGLSVYLVCFVGGCLCPTISSFSRVPFSSFKRFPLNETDSSGRFLWIYPGAWHDI